MTNQIADAMRWLGSFDLKIMLVKYMKEEIRNRIDQYGKQIDSLSIEQQYDNLKLLLEEMEQFKNSDDEILNDAAFNYYIGTGLGTYSDYLVRMGKVHTDPDVIELRRTSMFYLRKGILLYDSPSNVDSRALLRILTNYANALDTAGRVLEALRIYRKVLEINNQFSIAYGNYGRALQFLGNMVNDGGHKMALHSYAYHAIQKALSIDDPDMHKQALTAFQKTLDYYERLSNYSILAEPIENKIYELGVTEEEKAYRKWCLNNHFFLNPLNEVIEIESAFAHDPLTIVKYTEDNPNKNLVSGSQTEPPRWFAMLNQLKEEYIYARYLCFVGSEKSSDVHFADKDVVLSLASYDFANYSIRIEQLKSSFRILYSMIDKICFFVNDFWKLGINERAADAFHICKSRKYPKNNIALVSLYWVLCEFFEKYGKAETPSEKNLSILRNALEHKFVKVHEYSWDGELRMESDSFYHVSEEDLIKNTMRLLEILREALMYLVYAVGIEESKKNKSEKVMLLHIPDFPDEWKQ